MSQLTVTDLNTLDPTQVSQNSTTIQAMLADLYPSLDLSPGSALNAQVVLPAAELETLKDTEVNAILQANLQNALNNPSSVDPTLLAALLSNYGLSPLTGTEAIGQVWIYLANSATVMISTASLFTAANGVVFQPTAAFTGTLTPTLPNNSQIYSTGNPAQPYFFAITVQATTVGVAGNISQGTVLTSNLVAPAVVSVAAAADFDGGSDTETNQQLVTRAAQGLTNKTLGDRNSIVAAVESAFSFVQDVSVIGAGDPEMQRSVNPLFNTKGAGKVDVYVRTRPTAVRVTFPSMSATLQDTSAGTWTVNLTRETYPGFYRVLSVYAPNSSQAGSLPITSVALSMDMSPIAGIDLPATLDTLNGAFTRYQAAVVTFTDTTNLTGLSVGASRTYSMDILGPPQIEPISDHFSARDLQCPGGDYLFKAAIPCAVALSLTIVQGLGDPNPNVATITTAVTNAVNQLDFQAGRLPVAQVVQAAQATLGPRSRVVLPVDIRGVIYAPSGQNLYLFGPGDLVAPNLPAALVSPRTVFFGLGTGAVSVNVLPPDQSLV